MPLPWPKKICDTNYLTRALFAVTNISGVTPNSAALPPRRKHHIPHPPPGRGDDFCKVVFVIILSLCPSRKGPSDPPRIAGLWRCNYTPG